MQQRKCLNGRKKNLLPNERREIISDGVGCFSGWKYFPGFIARKSCVDVFPFLWFQISSHYRVWGGKTASACHDYSWAPNALSNQLYPVFNKLLYIQSRLVAYPGVNSEGCTQSHKLQSSPALNANARGPNAAVRAYSNPWNRFCCYSARASRSQKHFLVSLTAHL